MLSPPAHRKGEYASRIHTRMPLVNPPLAFEGKTVMGIDPGVTPAVACFFGSADKLEIHDETRMTFARKTTPDMSLIRDLLDGVQPDVVVMEHVTTMPQWGAVTTAAFIGAFRHIWGYVEGRGFPLLLLPPKKWQQIVITVAGKEYHRERATKLFPQHAHLFRRKKDHNRAASVLIALAGAMTCRGNSGGYMDYHLIQDHFAKDYFGCWKSDTEREADKVLEGWA